MTETIRYDLDHPLMVKQFSHIGLSQADVKGLPEDVRQVLSTGSLSPLLLLKIKQDENTYMVPARLRLGINDKSNQPELLIYGVSNKLYNIIDPNLDVNQNQAIKKGELVKIEKDGQTLYYQFDPVTKNSIRFSDKELNLDNKLNSVEKILDIELGKEQKDRIKEGKPVKLDVGGEDVTVGVDLLSPNAFKQLQGDMKEWERQKAIDYDIAHPEYIGLVQTEENRWEYLMIQTKGFDSKELKESPAQVKSSGMKL